MLERRNSSEQLCQTTKESSNLNEDVLHEIWNTEDPPLSAVQGGEPLEAQMLARMRAQTLECLANAILDKGDGRLGDASGTISVLSSPPCILGVDIIRQARPSIEGGEAENVTIVKASLLSSNPQAAGTNTLSVELCDATTASRSKVEILDFFTKVTDACLTIAREDSNGVGLAALSTQFQAKLFEQLSYAFGAQRVVEALRERFPELDKLLVEREQSQAQIRDVQMKLDQGLRKAFLPLSLGESFGAFFVPPPRMDGGGPDVGVEVGLMLIGIVAVGYAGIAMVGATHTMLFGWRHTIGERDYSRWSARIAQAVKSSEKHGIDSHTAASILQGIRTATESDWGSADRVTRPTADKIVGATMYALQRLDKDSVEPFLKHLEKSGISAQGGGSSKEPIKTVSKRVKEFFNSQR